MSNLQSFSLGILFGLALFALYLLIPHVQQRVYKAGIESSQPVISTTTAGDALSSSPARTNATHAVVSTPPVSQNLRLSPPLDKKGVKTSFDFQSHGHTGTANQTADKSNDTPSEHTSRIRAKHAEESPSMMNTPSRQMQQTDAQSPQTAKADHSPSHRREGRDSRTMCNKMKRKHNVVPGSSWGTLTAKQQQVWTELQCDQILQSSETAGGSTIEAEPMPDEAANSDQAWCWGMRKKYHVRPMQSWGSLPERHIADWKSKHCDMIFTQKRLAGRTLSTCNNDPTGSEVNPDTHPNMSPTLPLVAVMAATTTRKIDNPSTSNLALFNFLLPSLIRTLDCGFRYEYVLGYDKGDPFYDSEKGMNEVREWFVKNVKLPMEKNGIRISLRLVKVNNTLKKPGPVFLEMARAAYDAGANYFFRINDDTELLTNWAAVFVKALEHLKFPFGVVGPSCSQGNQKILTHDFVHRTHMEIFGMNYYPPQLTDWWMDDWISLVYGQTRTFKAKDVAVTHHTGAHGQRYAVDNSNEHLLSDLVTQGRKEIRQYMLKHQVDEKTLVTFDRDKFAAGFVHRDIPAAVK